MADFIAVIRRAVDGLSENTPEMRAKVYERAKSAVVRQLENMKPRPPEAMFQRQLDKLDAAIREVEIEHSDALPADDLPAAAPAGAARAITPEPLAAEPPRVAEQARPEPVAAVPAVEPEPTVTPAVQPAAPIEEPVAEIPVETARLVEPQTVVPAYITTEQPLADPVARLEPEIHPAQIDVAPYEAVPEISQEEIPGNSGIEATAESFVAEQQVYQPFTATAAESGPAMESQIATTQVAVPDVAASEPVAERQVEPVRHWAVDIDEEPQVASEEPVQDEPARPMPKVSYDESDVVAGFNDFVQQEMNRKVVPPPPSRKADKQDDFSWDAPFDDLPDIPKPVTFEKALEAKQREIGADHERRIGKQKPESGNARAELEDLIGIDPAQRRTAQIADMDTLPPDVSRVVSKLEGKSFRMQKKNKKQKHGYKLLPIALGVVCALVIGGGAYGLWHYRDNVSQLVASMLPKEEAAKPADTVKTDEKSEATSPVVKTDATADATQVKQPAKETEVASLDTGTQKFTQRLLPDGTESETDTARVPVDQALPEGKTVFGQTEKGKEVAETTATDAKSDATDTGKPQGDVQPLGATQKMFLYEERLGQSSPVAVPGTIIWREKADTEDGKPNPAIEGQIDIPQRKIKALMTFKRNTDASLPASHIIEIVFDLPKNFEEGNVDNIQRVAFKQTEQDRGNPLIAVPAKITDDFHMVALNDDADARKVNLELMKTRSWIDIPITYRNGRRALITLEKGATGTAVFDKVLSEWAALGAQTNNQ
ncbi:MAG: rane protein [Rhizobium sp.]|nr:rane protein [Rhizobium sp.]